MALALAIFILVLTVVIHELGHALAAKLVGLPIEEIQIGIAKIGAYTLPGTRTFVLKGKKIFVSWFLIGGAISIPEEDYWRAPPYKRIIVAIAGPLVNITVALLAISCFYGFEEGLKVTNEFAQATYHAVAAIPTASLETINGPVGLIDLLTQIIYTDPAKGTLFAFVLLNVALAVVNLIPLPALDGGHILLAYPASWFGKWGIAGARFATKGMFFLLLISMVALTTKDFYFLLTRLFTAQAVF